MPAGLRLASRVLAAFTRVVITILTIITVLGVVADMITAHWSRVPFSLVFAIVFVFLMSSTYRSTRRFASRETAPPTLVEPRPIEASAGDPGWKPSLRVTLPFVPDRSDEPARNGLTVLRSVFLAFTGALVLIANLVATSTALPNGPVVPWIPILIAFAALTLVGARATDRPLPCTSAQALAAAYRARFFLRVAFAESVALMAFTITFAGGPVWTYYVGLAFTFVRFATNVAPTRAAVARDQADLEARGCNLSLIAALNPQTSTT